MIKVRRELLRIGVVFGNSVPGTGVSRQVFQLAHLE